VVTRAVPSPRRRWLWILAGVVVFILLVLSVLSGFYIDVLWFREVGYTSVFWSVFWSKVVLGALFGLGFFVLLYANLLIVRRLTPRYRVFTPGQEVLERYRLAFEPYVGWILPALAAVLGIFVAIGVSRNWEVFLLWRNSSGAEFGQVDPIFHKDAAFYVFTLPFLNFVQGWLFSSLVGVAVIVVVAYYLWGGIRTQGPGERVPPQVRAHVSVLLGLIVLAKAWGYWLGRYDLLQSLRGSVVGASYTDVHAQKPALELLTMIAIVCAILFLVNVRFRIWALPVIGIVILGLVSVAAGAIWPAVVQRFSVAPQELQKEREYIGYNIAATRYAFQLDRIESHDVDATSTVSSEEVAANRGTIDNVRVWAPDVLLENFAQLQRSRQFYEFSDVDVDRYEIDGEQRVVMLAPREVSQLGIPENSKTWQNLHLVYTHGFGVVANQVNTATAEGAPVFTARDIPMSPTSIPLPEEPRIYYGEIEEVPFVVVNTGADELDYQGVAGDEQQQVTYDYQGTGGVKMGGFLQRLLFAWRFRDVNLLISGLIDGDSRILMYRDIRERIAKPAPFLSFDGDPYAVVVDGRIKWVLDAYTRTDAFPYSETVEFDQPGLDPVTKGLAGSANYLRNSVKVVVDAFDGTVTYYVVDETDPIVQVWRNAFPDLFVSGSQVPEELRAHFRYPEDLFRTQATMYSRYHVTDPNVFYGGTDRWAIPEDASTQGVDENRTEPEDVDQLKPYYVRMLVPGTESEQFVLFLPFTPEGREIMVSWMAAMSDPGSYGDLISFELPAGRNVLGPTQAFSQINQDPQFSAERTLLSQGGSSVRFGNLLVVPVGDSFLYVQPVFVKSTQTNAFPELKRVVVVNGGRVGIGSDLSEALAEAVGGEVPPPDDGEEPPPTGTLDEQIAALISQALQHFAAAQTALEAGQLGTYQTETEAAEELIAQAQALLEQSGVPGGETPSPEPTASASPTG
jgi:uncharacterized membrane protein (UPF0182 family)